MPALVHLNLDRELRGGLEGLRLARHADARCLEAGLPGWYGEINAPLGARRRRCTGPASRWSTGPATTP
jgi:hypothetical protein